MINILILILAVFLLGALLYFEKHESVKGKLLSKIPLSLLFIITAAIQSHPDSRYYYYLVIGMVLCLGGDVLLIFPDKKAFRLGLVSFLLGHIFYILAFIHMSHFRSLPIFISSAAVAFSVGVFIRLRTHLGEMLIPVMGYIIIITVMVLGAGSVFQDTALDKTGRIMVFSGALAFYFSDVFVARQRFVKQIFLNRLAGLPLYYLGQFLLAFSVGILHKS
ncbi:MAG: lysoplasmalogenase [Desulfobacteraceae bacterium]|nr:lysoplasmalogenase [Desulfobacteraceae bacterium]